MKIRQIKLTPEVLTQIFQGKSSGFHSKLPSDAELLDIKLDLFSNQVIAIVRSDSFEDVAESYPIPEFNCQSAIPNLKLHPNPYSRKNRTNPIAKIATVQNCSTEQNCNKNGK